MKKVLLISSGAREHAIGEALKRSSSGVDLIVFAATKNPGLVNLASRYETADLQDFDALKNLVEQTRPDFAIIGPEDPLANGIVDFLASLNVPAVGPTKAHAQLESSKSFARNLLNKYQIPGNPDFKVFENENGLREYMEEPDGQVVIKYDGLKGGKGVKVMGDHLQNIEEAYDYAKECLELLGKVVVEEKLIGQEFSLMSFCDGKTVIDMPPAQDHKRAYEGDKGPNTGGMGSYSDANHLLPFLKQEDIDQAHLINQKVAEAMHAELRSYFKGILYGGFIITKKGVKLIEYNVRFGDPEAENVLPILKTDFVKICEAIINGTLDQIQIEFENKATVCKYAVPEGYPDTPVKNELIEIPKMPANVNIYFASVDQREEGLYLCGSRAVAVVGIGEDLKSAQALAEEGVSKIKGPVFHRRDIGTETLIGERVKMMEELRNRE